MAATKVTFTLGRISLERLQDAAERLALPKSEVVREAIMEFHDRLGGSRMDRETPCGMRLAPTRRCVAAAASKQ